MGNILRKITHLKKSGETWINETELPSARWQDITKGWGSMKDQANVKLSKANFFFDDANVGITPQFEESDLIRIYLAQNVSEPHTFTESDLFFEGSIDNLPQTLSGAGNEVSIKLNNFAEVFFDVEIPFYETEKNAMELAQQVVNDLNKAGTRITWDPTNPTLKKDDTTEFPLKALSLNYTPAFVIFEKLFSDEYTGDGQYYWYISRGATGFRQLTVRPRDDTITGTIDETFAINDVSISKGKDNIRNYIIYNTGIDFYGVSVEGFYYEASSIGNYGWKTYYALDETGDIFYALFRDEFTNNTSSFTVDSQGNLNTYFPSSYPYTFFFDSSVTAANDAEFNEELRVKSLALGELKAQSISDEFSKSSHVTNINMPLNLAYEVGGLYQIDLSRIRTFSKKQRLRQITYTYNGMTLSFDQDSKDKEI